MLLWDVPSYPAVVVPCRAVGVLQVEQNRVNNQSSERIRSDRILALPIEARRENALSSVDGLRARPPGTRAVPHRRNGTRREGRANRRLGRRNDGAQTHQGVLDPESVATTRPRRLCQGRPTLQQTSCRSEPATQQTQHVRERGGVCEPTIGLALTRHSVMARWPLSRTSFPGYLVATEPSIVEISAKRLPSKAQGVRNDYTGCAPGWPSCTTHEASV